MIQSLDSPPASMSWDDSSLSPNFRALWLVFQSSLVQRPQSPARWRFSKRRWVELTGFPRWLSSGHYDLWGLEQQQRFEAGSGWDSSASSRGRSLRADGQHAALLTEVSFYARMIRMKRSVDPHLGEILQAVHHPGMLPLLGRPSARVAETGKLNRLLTLAPKSYFAVAGLNPALLNRHLATDEDAPAETRSATPIVYDINGELRALQINRW